MSPNAKIIARHLFLRFKSMRYLLSFFSVLTFLTNANLVSADIIQIKFTENDSYSIEVAHIDIGDTIEWLPKNKGHNVEFMVAPDDIKFKSKMHKSAGYRFEVPGIYTYKCTPHVAAGMIGVVIVGGDISNIVEAREHKGYYGQSKQLILDLLSKFRT